MKYRILFILFILSVIFSCDKEEFSLDQADPFIKYFGGDKPFAGMQVLTAEDGGYIVLGNIENSGRSQDICLVRTDKNGNTIGPMKVYGGLFDDFAYAIKKNAFGYIIAGSTKASRLGDKNIYLIQINELGDTLWTKSFGESFDDEAFDVLVLDNGHLVVTGYSEGSDNNSDLFVAKVSPSGVVVWNKPHGFPENNEVGNTIVQAGHYFIIGGSTNNRPVQYGTTNNAYMLQVTTAGVNPLPIYFGTEGDSEIRSLVNAGNNTYYAACNMESSQRDESQIRIIKFKHDDRDRPEILWTKDFGEQTFNRISCIRANNNSVTLVGTSGANIETGDLLLMKLDAEGNTPEYFYTGDGTSFKGTGFDYTSDGGYIITGSNYSSENSVITLAKLNSEGNF